MGLEAGQGVLHSSKTNNKTQSLCVLRFTTFWGVKSALLIYLLQQLSENI